VPSWSPMDPWELQRGSWKRLRWLWLALAVLGCLATLAAILDAVKRTGQTIASAGSCHLLLQSASDKSGCLLGCGGSLGQPMCHKDQRARPRNSRDLSLRKLISTTGSLVTSEAADNPTGKLISPVGLDGSPFPDLVVRRGRAVFSQEQVHRGSV
jgi:hypothetical protein